MKIRFQGQYDRKTFFAAVRLANAPRTGGRVTFWLALGAFFGLGFVAWRAWLAEPTLASVGMYLLLLFILLAFIGQYLLPPWFTARKLWADPNVRRPLKGWADERGLTYQLPDGDRRLEWGRFLRLRARPGLLTLVTREGLMLLFTPQFFKNPAQWQKFLRLVRSKVISTQ